MTLERRKTKQIKAGNVNIGSDSQVTVQSMLSVPSTDVKASIMQAVALEKAGCDIVRIAVPDSDAVKLIFALKENIKIPVVADIHFNHNLALESAEAGADKIRINPGNIGSDDKVRLVAEKCKQKNIPIRIGVNSGSLEKEILAKHGGITPQAMCESALYHTQLLNKFDFDDIVISIKSSDVQKMVAAYEMMAGISDYPLHLGVTEAGTYISSLIKSSAGIGSLLLHGIGDTIRISMTDDPLKEVKTALDLLNCLSIRNDRPTIVACPTCGRTRIDLIKLAKDVEEALVDCRKPIKIAVMGCVVNGPGEASDADIGIAGGDGCAILFKNGEVIKKVSENNIVSELLSEIEKM